MDWRRRAQAGAAVLIALIAVLIIMYVLFLPPADRAVLLNETSPATAVNTTGSNVIFQTVPTVAQQQGPETHGMPPFTVRTQTSGNVLADRSSLSVSRTAFSNSPETVVFDMPSSSSNPLLSFTASSSTGGLRVLLNNVSIFDAVIQHPQVAPIQLPAGMLTSHNTLTFEADPVGFAIWQSHQTNLVNVRVTADVTSFAQAGQTQRIAITDPASIQSAGLVFVPDCPQKQGRLTVTMNGETIYSGFPDCGIPVHVELAQSHIKDGENVLSFSVGKGEYSIDQASVNVLRQQQNTQKSFTISQNLLSQVAAQQRPILLRLAFAQPEAQGVIILNGQQLAFRTHQQSFAAPITQYLHVGSNTIQVAQTSVGIVSLSVLSG